MNKTSHDKNPRGSESGNDQQAPRRDRENMGAGSGSQTHGENQGREGGRGSISQEARSSADTRKGRDRSAGYYTDTVITGVGDIKFALGIGNSCREPHLRAGRRAVIA